MGQSLVIIAFSIGFCHDFSFAKCFEPYRWDTVNYWTTFWSGTFGRTLIGVLGPNREHRYSISLRLSEILLIGEGNQDKFRNRKEK